MNNRTVPRDIESERAVLSAIVRDIELIDDLQIRADWLTVPHQAIFAKIIELGSLVSLTSLVVALKESGQLENVGGPAYIAQITGEFVHRMHAHFYVEKVRNAFIRREIIRIATDASSGAYEPGPESGISLVSDLEQGITKLVSEIESRASQEQPFKEMVIGAVEALEGAYASRGAIQGMSSGIRPLDRLTGGFRNKHLIVVAARPSEGKTALGLHIADTCLAANIPVGFISLEMPGSELAERLLSRVSQVDSTRVRDGMIGPRDFPSITAAAGKLCQYPLFIDDRSGLTIAQVASKARVWKRKHGIKVLIVDYLQLMRSGSKRASDNRQIEVAEISSGCKAIAKELDIPVIVMAQLNRAPESGGKIRKPRLSDLRESGAIEADADAVILLQRKHEEETKGKGDSSSKPDDVLRDVYLILAKQRNGPIGEMLLQFACPFHTFREITNRHE